MENKGKFTTPVEPERRGEGKFFSSLTPGNRWGLVPLARQFEVRPRDKETLDVLAMDRDGVPWVFEFKRAVADADAIGQLLAYSSWIAVMPTAQIIKRVMEQNPRIAPGELFGKHFKTTPPERLSHSVHMVLVAYSFSPWCLRLVDFLAESCGVQIGLLTMQLIGPTAINSTVPEFAWEREPSASLVQAPALSPGRTGLLILSAAHAARNWPRWSKRGAIDLPKALRRFADLFKPGSGIFIAIRGRGLIGYGAVRTRERSGRECPRLVVDWKWTRILSRPLKLPEILTRKQETASLLPATEAGRYLAAIGQQIPSKANPGRPMKSQDRLVVTTGVRGPSGSSEFKRERRRQAFALFKSGCRPAQVARELKVSETSAGRWLSQWTKLGGRAAPKATRRGRPSGLSEKQQKILSRALRKPPEITGKQKSEAHRWTAALFRQFIKRRFRIDFHPSHSARLLKKLRPATASKEAEPKRMEGPSRLG